MDWIQDHMRDHLHNSTDSSEKILNFPHNDSVASRCDTTNVLDLLSQAIEAIRNDQYRIKESEARTKYLAERAVENLKSDTNSVYRIDAPSDRAGPPKSKHKARRPKQN